MKGVLGYIYYVDAMGNRRDPGHMVLSIPNAPVVACGISADRLDLTVYDKPIEGLRTCAMCVTALRKLKETERDTLRT